AVTDGLLVTAGPTEPVAFAREVFRLLGAYDETVIDPWFRLFHDSDPAAYAAYEKALSRRAGPGRNCSAAARPACSGSTASSSPSPRNWPGPPGSPPPAGRCWARSSPSR